MLRSQSVYYSFWSFFFNDTATTEIYTSIDTLSLHDALPISTPARRSCTACPWATRSPTRSEEHTSELQSPIDISYAVFCLKKKKKSDSESYLLILKITDVYLQG